LLILAPGNKPVGSSPCLFRCVPANPTRACPIVDNGVYTPSFKPPPAYPKPLDASVFVPIRERIFSLAKNK
jgi:hypothetical protein